MSALGQKRTFHDMSGLPPKADIGTQPRDVRFVPKADILRRSKGVYSITSSALTNIDPGIGSPIPFAVFRLMTNSNLVGCSTGISSGLVPRRMLSAISAIRAKSTGKFDP